MKPIIIVAIVLLIVAGGFFLNQTQNQSATNPNDETEEKLSDDQVKLSTARDAALGYEFSYREEPNGYITFEDNESTHPDFATGLMLINRQAYEELTASTDAREGPPAIHFRVYKNPENLHAPVWALRNSSEINYQLKIGEETETVVGGANATRFTADGLYPIDTYVVTSGEHIYVLMGAYYEKNDQIYQDFQDLVKSFRFIEPGSSPSKLDPAVACQNALSYMLFETGEAADQFVADCIDGKHPEIIERYIEEQGLSEAMI